MNIYVITSHNTKRGRKVYRMQKAADITRPAALTIPFELSGKTYTSKEAAIQAALTFDPAGRVTYLY